jgi:TfoX/Sxy family transcriptional regulator of competence genes
VAYDEELADRVRVVLADEPGLTERKMFGGLAFMIGGNMACGIVQDELMLRLGAEGADAALDEPHVREMDFTGRPMTGMVYVERADLDDAGLRRWVERAAAFARSLPPKAKT